jgi:hypothetical protein
MFFNEWPIPFWIIHKHIKTEQMIVFITKILYNQLGDIFSIIPTDSCWMVWFWKIRRKTIWVLGPDVHNSCTNSALAWTLNMLYLFCKNKNPFSCIFVYIYVGRNNTEDITKLILWRSVVLVEETGVPGQKPPTCRKSLTNCIT